MDKIKFTFFFINYKASNITYYNLYNKQITVIIYDFIGIRKNVNPIFPIQILFEMVTRIHVKNNLMLKLILV